MRLLVSVVLAVGVKLAIQVQPPSIAVTADSVPLAIVKSALVKSLTTSLKVIVTAELSPAVSAVSATKMLAVGRRVSMLITGVLPAPPLLPAASV